MSQDQPPPPESEPTAPDSEPAATEPSAAEQPSSRGGKDPIRKDRVKQGKRQAGQQTQSVLTKFWHVIQQVLGFVLTQLDAIFSKSKLYRDLITQLERLKEQVHPILAGLQWVWGKVLQPLWHKVVQPLWAKILTLLRPRLPQPLQALSDRGLTLAVLGLVLLVFWVSSALSPGPAPVRAKQPPPTPPPAPKVVPSPPVTPVPIEQFPEPEAVVPVEPVPTEPITEEPVLEEPVLEEPVLEEPATPEPVSAEPAMAELPTVKIDPQRVLEIQDQVAKMTDRFSEDLIQSVQANFETNDLVVQVSDRWYDLNESQQDEVGLEVLQRSKTLAFQTLEFRDQQGALVARNPVVGSSIVILQR